MLIAERDGRRIGANPCERDANWPNCGANVIAKCGEIKIWHWAHEARTECDPWAEEETLWHRQWKSHFPANWQEVIVGGHRADVRNERGRTFEFQHSAISGGEIREREAHYGRGLCWIVDMRERRNHFEFRFHDSAEQHRATGFYGYYTFRWKWPKPSWWVARRPLFFDFGESLFRIVKIYHKIPCGGWGRFVPGNGYAEFLEWAIGERTIRPVTRIEAWNKPEWVEKRREDREQQYGGF